MTSPTTDYLMGQTTPNELLQEPAPFAANAFPSNADYKYRVTFKTPNGVTVTAQGDEITQVVTDLTQLIHLANGVVATPAPRPVQQPSAQPSPVMNGAPAPVWAPPPAPGPVQQHGLPAAPQAPVWPSQPQQPAQFGQQPTPGSLHPNALCQHGQPYIFRSGVARNTGNPYSGYYCQLPKGQSCPPMK